MTSCQENWSISENTRLSGSSNGHTSSVMIIISWRMEKGSVSGSLYFNLIKWRGIVSFEAFQYFPHFVRIGNDCNYFHLMAAFFTYERINLIHFLNKPRPAQPWCLVWIRIYCLRFLGGFLFGCGIAPKLCEAAVFVCLPLCPAGIQSIIARNLKDCQGALCFGGMCWVSSAIKSFTLKSLIFSFQ